MKKLVLMFVAIAAISFASCGGNKTANTEVANDSDSVAVQDSDSVQAPQDSLANDSVAK